MIFIFLYFKSISALRQFRIFFLLAFVCLPFTNYSIDYFIDWLPPHTNLRQRIHVETRQIEQEISADNWVSKGPILLEEQDLQELVQKSSRADYFYRPDHKIRFVFQGNGIVFDFDTITHSLKRVDRTMHSGYNFSAIRFYRNDVLYSIGGEGFWSYNRHITYFDDKTTKEWEILRPKNLGPAMISDGFQGYSATDDMYYSGGSNHKNFLEDEKIEYPKEFQRFNFKTKTWEVLGNISPKIPLEEHRTIFWNGTHFVQMARDRLYIIDPIKNEVYEYKDNATYFEVGGDHYISGDTIKYYHFAHRGPIASVPVLALLKKSKYLGKFYEVDYTSYYLIGISLLVLVALVYGIYIKKRKLEPTFDALERKLLQALLTAGDECIPTNELNEILECGTKSQENQRRIRFMTIKQVNEKLAFYYNIKNAIERTASTEDKRLITYRLKKGVKEKLKAIL
ncbi:MAG: hypothetical protein RL567_1187 [Bacteroidota bacterium]